MKTKNLFTSLAVAIIYQTVMANTPFVDLNKNTNPPQKINTLQKNEKIFGIY